MVKGLHR